MDSETITALDKAYDSTATIELYFQQACLVLLGIMEDPGKIHDCCVQDFPDLARKFPWNFSKGIDSALKPIFLESKYGDQSQDLEDRVKALFPSAHRKWVQIRKNRQEILQF